MVTEKSINIEYLEETVIVKFNRPENRNPLSVNVLKRLYKIIAEIEFNSAIKKIIFTGTDEIFASGANLREIAELTQEDAGEFALRGQSLMKKIDECPKLTIAAVNGVCFGGGLDLALSCDVRIASPSAVFCHPGANLGIITGWGGTQRLPRLIGEAKALEMFFTAKRLDANEALQIGLIDEICGNPLERALAYRKSAEAS